MRGSAQRDALAYICRSPCLRLVDMGALYSPEADMEPLVAPPPTVERTDLHSRAAPSEQAIKRANPRAIGRILHLGKRRAPAFLHSRATTFHPGALEGLPVFQGDPNFRL